MLKQRTQFGRSPGYMKETITGPLVRTQSPQHLPTCRDKTICVGNQQHDSRGMGKGTATIIYETVFQALCKQFADILI